MKVTRLFTLLELLLVIAIFGILLTILLPSLRKAREKAKIAVCASNLHQTGTAIQIYCADNDNSFPYYYQSCVSWLGPAGIRSWMQTEKPLNKIIGPSHEELSKCPSRKGNYWDDLGTNYYNNTRWSANTLGDDVLKQAQVNDPARMVQMYEDGAWWWIYSAGNGNWGSFQNEMLFHSQKTGQFNINFVDGHVGIMNSLQAGLDNTSTYTFNNRK